MIICLSVAVTYGIDALELDKVAWSPDTLAPRPTLSAPSDGEHGVSLQPTLEWARVTGAVSYRVQVSVDPGFRNLHTDETRVATTSVALSRALSPDTVYWWRVCASTQERTGSWSDTDTFSTVAASIAVAPKAPTLYSPANGATGMSTTPTLTWNPVSGATSYRVQVSTDPSFSTPHTDEAGLTASFLTTTRLNAGTPYWWRVQASNSKAGNGDWSDAWRLTTALPSTTKTLAAPTLATPSNGAAGVSMTPVLTWSQVMGATSYQVQTALDGGFERIVLDHAAVTMARASVTLEETGTLYWWRVRARGPQGVGSWSAAWSFESCLPLAESPHPYPNDCNRTWVITSPGVHQMRVHFARLELDDAVSDLSQEDNDAVEVAVPDGVSTTQAYGGTWPSFWTEWFTIDTMNITLRTDSSGAGYGFLVDRMETRWSAAPPASLAESYHPYANNYTYTWLITSPRASKIRAHFARLELAAWSHDGSIESDVLKLLDNHGQLLSVYSVTTPGEGRQVLAEQDIWTDWFAGDAISVELTTDSEFQAYGFLIDQIETQ